MTHDRSAQLRSLAEEQGRHFRVRFVGRTLQVLAFAERRADGRLRGLTGNFIEVALTADDEAVNRLVEARIDGIDGQETRASVLPVPESSGTGAMTPGIRAPMPQSHTDLAIH